MNRGDKCVTYTGRRRHIAKNSYWTLCYAGPIYRVPPEEEQLPLCKTCERIFNRLQAKGDFSTLT